MESHFLDAWTEWKSFRMEVNESVESKRLGVAVANKRYKIKLLIIQI